MFPTVNAALGVIGVTYPVSATAYTRHVDEPVIAAPGLAVPVSVGAVPPCTYEAAVAVSVHVVGGLTVKSASVFVVGVLT